MAKVTITFEDFPVPGKFGVFGVEVKRYPEIVLSSLEAFKEWKKTATPAELMSVTAMASLRDHKTDDYVIITKTINEPLTPESIERLSGEAIEKSRVSAKSAALAEECISRIEKGENPLAVLLDCSQKALANGAPPVAKPAPTKCSIQL